MPYARALNIFVPGGSAVRRFFPTVLALTCACGAPNSPHTLTESAASSGETALGLNQPALLNFNVRSAAFDIVQEGSGHTIFLVLSDVDDVCAQMQQDHHPVSSRRLELTLVDVAGEADLTGQYLLQQQAGVRVISGAKFEIIDAQGDVSRPTIGSGEVNVTGIAQNTVTASVRVALSALAPGRLGSFQDRVTFDACPGIKHPDAPKRSQWTCP